MDAVLGIDIGKTKFHVTLRFADGTRRRKACANSPAGCTDLLAWLTRQGAARVHACLEATGTYGELLVTCVACHAPPTTRVPAPVAAARPPGGR